jgi:hypothetical protein
MLIFDRTSAPSTPTDTVLLPLTLPTDPPTDLQITPAAMDAFSIFSDLCLLTSIGDHKSGGDKEKPRILNLTSLHRTFGLELVESILSGYEEGVKQVSAKSFRVRTPAALTRPSGQNSSTSCNIP